ncbi:MocR-like pyridoxine biosynthesis transcription factor PdxR [Caballeronia sordidicola]|uniref:MocR-like pyridoxine biosynthesis transcription factor PdxR n=1 Tax=Caballeronia sordidicola TaxID=196367 RepID=UPI0015C5BECD|nr:PLP-dependent aminotransferase family protein [Caballeronia sordidicola]
MVDFLIRLDGVGSIQQQVYKGIYNALAEGRLEPGQRFPASRTWALELGVSRNTIREATASLIVEGWLEARSGSGLYVRDALPPNKITPSNPSKRPQLSQWSDRLPPTMMLLSDRHAHCDFRPGEVSRDAENLLRPRRLARWPSDLEPGLLSKYNQPEGDLRLRERIAAYLRQSRSVRCTSSNIVITTGTRQSLDILSRLLLGPATSIAVEDPGYPVVADIARLCGADLVPLQVDENGIKVADIPAGISAVYCTPNHQFPLGVSLSMERRHELLARAAANNFVIVEDDYDCEFYYGAMPPPCLQSMDKDDRIIYVGSLSKTLAPAFRAGFIVSPPWLGEKVRMAKWAVDRQTSTHVQNTLLQLMVSGEFASHLKRMRTEYAKRRATLLEDIRRLLRNWLIPLESSCGLHISARVIHGYDAQALCRIADANGVGIYQAREFSTTGRAADILVFGFGRTSLEEIKLGIGLLATGWQKEASSWRT